MEVLRDDKKWPENLFIENGQWQASIFICKHLSFQFHILSILMLFSCANFFRKHSDFMKTFFVGIAFGSFGFYGEKMGLRVC